MNKAAFFLLITLFFATAVYAQPPSENPAENACYAGGALAGKCDTEWAWTCGWYLAKFYQGTAAGVPLTCQSLVSVLPPELQKPGALVYVPPYEPEIGTPQDNACHVGGSMAGKCDTDWAWTCGWYLARYEAGVFNGVPANCQILLDVKPPRIIPSANSDSGIPTCFISAQTIPPGGEICIVGNVYTGDRAPRDGIVDLVRYLFKDTIVGQAAPCPPGTIYIGDVDFFFPDIQAFVLLHGFPITGDVCT